MSIREKNRIHSNGGFGLCSFEEMKHEGGKQHRIAKLRSSSTRLIFKKKDKVSFSYFL